MVTLSIPLQQRAFSFANFPTKQNHASSTLQHLHFPTQIRCSCKQTLFALYRFILEFFFFNFIDQNEFYRLLILCAATRDDSKSVENLSQFKELRNVACGILAVWAVTAVSPVIAASQVKI